MRRLLLGWELLRAEGVRGMQERLADRRATLAQRRAEKEVSLGELLEPGARIAVLDVLATPLAPRFGGVPTQLGPRLAEEERLRPTALLSPEADGWTLHTVRRGARLRARLGPCRGSVDPRDGLRADVPTVVEAATRIGAGVVNLEGLAGWPPDALGSLANGPRKLVLSLHDFALYCPRPNLVEEPHGRFCGYSADAARCRACLAASWPLPAGFVEAWRRAAGALLASADAAVYPSEFLRRQHSALFGVASRLERVIAPPAPGEAPADSSTGSPASSGGGKEPFHVAFVGAYRPHKGALVFEELLGRHSGSAARPVRWSIYGSGDPGLLLRAKGLGARVRGHYRAGGLVRRLREERVDLALLLSVWPETFSLTLSECRAAGVPVLAFEHGAIADRVHAEGGGVLVPLEEGAAGVDGALRRLLAGELELAPLRGNRAEPSASQAAVERLALYRELLGEAP
ncbi:MAG: glycosyltransferase [Holophagales bacterium]|nr:glycosyltransferase [Holophagales bacterium]